ncbi:hypothetical protein IWZ03DRAFT_429065 [Phyllosticta citriasiana]|uniref:Uncharacterized protein n=1 Tax=Phyllosticta citriasiana TaxID=595635 RepID=A0ABR1KZ68_9PEZI
MPMQRTATCEGNAVRRVGKSHQVFSSSSPSTSMARMEGASQRANASNSNPNVKLKQASKQASSVAKLNAALRFSAACWVAPCPAQPSPAQRQHQHQRRRASTDRQTDQATLCSRRLAGCPLVTFPQQAIWTRLDGWTTQQRYTWREKLRRQTGSKLMDKQATVNSQEADESRGMEQSKASAVSAVAIISSDAPGAGQNQWSKMGCAQERKIPHVNEPTDCLDAVGQAYQAWLACSSLAESIGLNSSAVGAARAEGEDDDACRKWTVDEPVAAATGDEPAEFFPDGSH